MTVNEQLMNMYEPHFNELIKHLEDDGVKDKVQAPFLLGIDRKDENGNTIANGDWYTKADIKVMFFGRETSMWGWRNPSASDDYVEGYEDFYGINYRENNSGVFFLVDSDSKLYKRPFFSVGLNGLMSIIVEKLENNFSGKRAAFLWNDISKLTSTDGKAVDPTTHELEKKYFHVIPSEIRILKPDIIVFLTGFGKNGAKYDGYIKENFNETEGFPIHGKEALSGIDITDVEKLDIQGIHLAYKTHHPQGMDGRKLSDQYKAIANDIEAHFDEIIK